MRARITLAVLSTLCFLVNVTYAQDAEQLSRDFVKVYTVVSYVATVKSYCDSAVPASKAINTAALDAWKKVNAISQFESITVKFTEKTPAIKASLASVRGQMLEKVRSSSGNEAKFCSQLPRLLKDPATQVGTLYKTQIAQLAQMFDGNAMNLAPAQVPAAGQLKLEPGHYTCTEYHTRTAAADQSDRTSRYYGQEPRKNENSAKPWYRTFDLFANGEYSFSENSPIKLPDNNALLEWPREMGHYRVYLNTDVNYYQIKFISGGFQDYNGWFKKQYDVYQDRPNYYKTAGDGRLVVILRTTNNGVDIDTIECYRKSDTLRKLPSQMLQASENPDLYLQPVSLKSAPPTAGSGGLEGVYLSADAALFLSRSGYASTGWRWGFERLNCTRVVTPGGPLKHNNCEQYKVKGDTIIFSKNYSGNTETYKPQQFQKRPNGELLVGDRLYKPIVLMKNLRLDGQFSYRYGSSNGSTASGGTQTIKLTRDGKFSFASDSYAAVNGGGQEFTGTSADQDPEASGTYSLNGYSITLSYTSGIKVDYSFLLEPGGRAFRLLDQRYERDQ